MKKRDGVLIAGALSMGVALAVAYGAGAFLRSVPYPPARLAALVVRLTPGDLATAAIERLGHWALRSLSILVHAGVLAFGAYLAGVVNAAVSPQATARRALGCAGGLFAAATLLALTAPEGVSIGAPLVYAACAWAFARMAGGAPLRVAFEPHVRAGEAPLDALQRSRRRFIVRSAAAVGGFLLGGAATLRFFAGKIPVDVEIVPADLGFVPPPDDAAFPRLSGLTSEITRNRDFYVVDINLVKPTVDHNGWTLKVHGRVRSPFTLTYRRLQTSFEVVEMAHTLTCISNEVGGDLISTAVWRGVRLRDVLGRAGLLDGVVDIVFRAVEGYSDSIPLEKALEETTLVVFGMNGVALPREHGFPARIIVPGIYGMKNVKWLTEIEAVDHDYRGYWEVRGWSDVARVKTQSRIDVPKGGRAATLPERIGGVAWAGDRGIARVEVSEDGGATWREALLRRELSPVAWRLWAADLSPGRGRRRVMVRATDSSGEVQSSRVTRPHPDGASGRHSVVLEIE